MAIRNYSSVFQISLKTSIVFSCRFPFKFTAVHYKITQSPMHDIKYIGAAGESLQLFMYAFILFDIVTYRVSLNDIQGRYENPVAYFRYNYSIKTNQLLDRVSFAKYWVRCFDCF